MEASLHGSVKAAKSGKRSSMHGNIHRRLVPRLVIAAVALAGLLGFGVFYHQLEQVDDRLVGLARTESDHLIRRILPHMPPRSAQDAAAVESALRDFVISPRAIREGRFVFGEVYDPDRRPVAEVVEADKRHLEAEMDRGGHKFPKVDVWYRKIRIAEELYLQAVVPLRAPDGRAVGFFEGVYRVDPDTLAAIGGATTASAILVVVATLLTAALLYPVVLGLNRDLIARSQDLLQANLNTLETLGDAIAKRDSDTGVHNYRVTLFAIRLGEAVGLGEATIQALIKGAFLHDLGKIGIGDAILLKPGRLTEDEFEVMKTHVGHGVDIVSRSAWLEDAADVVRYHHEKYDGSGYQGGLKGEDIPVTARVFAIVDVFDALTSRRPYKAPLGLKESLDILHKGRGTHFDPRLLDAFLDLAPGLHAAYGGREDAVVEKDLQALMQRYFG
ncbi:MAG: HD domain-containing protein [Magnetospirillum sp. WYHS-4]